MKKTLGNSTKTDVAKEQKLNAAEELKKLEANREYKSDLFSLLMQKKEYALNTYNAINGSDYDNPDDIQIQPLERGIYLSIRNDASFILDMSSNYYEHQSTYNPNMPLRHLIYCVEDIKRENKAKNRNIYGKKRIKLPTPHFVVFYNGAEERDEVEYQKLSESYEKETDEPELELTCKVININPGKNREMMEKATVLSDYTELIERIRMNENNGMELYDAIHTAISECIEDGVLAEFLEENRSEVERTMMLDYSYSRQLEMVAEEAHEDGKAEGREEGKLKVITKAIRGKKYTIEEAAKEFGVSEEAIRKALAEQTE